MRLQLRVALEDSRISYVHMGDDNAIVRLLDPSQFWVWLQVTPWGAREAHGCRCHISSMRPAK